MDHDDMVENYCKNKVKVAKKYFLSFFLSFWAKHDSYDDYLKYRLVQNRICERHF